MPRTLCIAATLALLLCAGCHQTGDADQPVATTPATPASTPAASAAPAPSPTQIAGVDLTIYAGKHPLEPVGGVAFLDQPAVKAAVKATVPDAGVRDFVFHYSGPDAPITITNGRVLAWGCEEHNCGYHNWSVSITPDGDSAQVCFYHNDDSAEGPATWYLPGGKTERRPGNCPST